MMSRATHRAGRRIAFGLLVAIAALGVVATSAWGAGAKRGYAAVEAVDPVARTVTLKGEVYALLPQTDFQNAKGARGSLRDLHAMPAGGSDAQLLGDVDWVYFEATPTPTGWVLTRLHIQEGAPQ